MNVTDFTYHLPDALIADNPPKTRGTSRLLVLHRNSGTVEDSNYRDVVRYLEPGDLLVLNDTRVIKARLLARKDNGAVRELVLLEKHGRNDDWHRHKVVYRRSLKPGDRLQVGNETITVESVLGDGLAIIRSRRDLLAITEAHGQVPLPPYMRREATAEDVERYQTVWAKEQGSVAAPTASLNMTKSILDSLQEKGVRVAYLTLHVGLGTFMPIRADHVEDHRMHQEYFEIPADTVTAIQAAKVERKRVVALGTTVARTLEYAHEQLTGSHQTISGEADIFIYPGYAFKTINGLLTNYHAPKSTVLMLTAAFAGWPNLRAAYEHAVEERYRFLSYGDSMLII